VGARELGSWKNGKFPFNISRFKLRSAALAQVALDIHRRQV